MTLHAAVLAAYAVNQIEDAITDNIFAEGLGAHPLELHH